jgi:hypothetical protein
MSFHKITTRAEWVKLMGVKTPAMYLADLHTVHVSRDSEVIAGRFTDHREFRELPDAPFAFIYPRTLDAETIRMHLFSWVATEEKWRTGQDR